MTKGSDQIKTMNPDLWRHEVTYKDLAPVRKGISDFRTRRLDKRTHTEKQGIAVYHCTRRRSAKQLN